VKAVGAAVRRPRPAAPRGFCLHRWCGHRDTDRRHLLVSRRIPIREGPKHWSGPPESCLPIL